MRQQSELNAARRAIRAALKRLEQVESKDPREREDVKYAIGRLESVMIGVPK